MDSQDCVFLVVDWTILLRMVIPLISVYSNSVAIFCRPSLEKQEHEELIVT
jgi:hypothetical protein